jgi:hypothetical protein
MLSRVKFHNHAGTPEPKSDNPDIVICEDDLTNIVAEIRLKN